MKISNKLSIATLVMTGAFVTGCSQQQIEGGSQMGSQQQVEEAIPVVRTPTAAPVARVAPPAPRPVVRRPKPRPQGNRWTHTHPAIPRCTKSIRHTHKYNSARHSHKYGCRKAAPRAMAAPTAQPPKVNVHALQRKLAAKGYYKGPIDGVVGPATRSALQRFMQR